jgi:hypothetical protein
VPRRYIVAMVALGVGIACARDGVSERQRGNTAEAPDRELVVPQDWFRERPPLRAIVPESSVLALQEWWIGAPSSQHRYQLRLEDRGPRMFSHVSEQCRRLGAPPDVELSTGILRASGAGWHVLAIAREQSFALIIDLNREVPSAEIRAAAARVPDLVALLELADSLDLPSDMFSVEHGAAGELRAFAELGELRAEHIGSARQWLAAHHFQQGDRGVWGAQRDSGLLLVSLVEGLPLRVDLNQAGWSGVPPRFTPLPLPR